MCHQLVSCKKIVQTGRARKEVAFEQRMELLPPAKVMSFPHASAEILLATHSAT